MEHFHNLTDVQLDRPSIVTIGNFDGVHRGHQQLIRQQVAEAYYQNAQAVALTFFPHPKHVTGSSKDLLYLTAPDERAALLDELGIALVITHPFDESVRQTRAANFVDQLLSHLKMSELWIGPDFALGYKREGDVDFLTALGEKRGFEVRVVEVVTREGRRFSSSDIRAMLYEGKVEQAALNLGRPHRISGTVKKGAQRGHRLGFPTANLDVWAERAIPAVGVYAGWAWIGDEKKRYAAVTNIGVRPTFDDGQERTIEAHLLDFKGDLYGQEVVFDFVARLRGEQRFENVDALVKQITEDVGKARGALGVA